MLTYLLSFVIGSQYNLLPPPSSWSASRARIIEYALCPYFSRKMLREVFALASFTVKIRASSHACASSSGTRCSYVLPKCVYMCRERESVCMPAPHTVLKRSCLCVCVCVCVYVVCVCVCTYIEYVCVCLRLDIGYPVLMRLA